MDVELAKTIAAIGLLGLGLVALELLLFTRYRKSRKLAATIGSASIRAIEAGTYDYQIDLDLKVKDRDVYLKELEIAHTVAVFDPDKGVKKYSIPELIDHPGYCTLDGKKEEFPATIKTLYENLLNAANLILTRKAHKRLTLAGRVFLSQCDGEYWDWPTEGWRLTMRTSVGDIEIPLIFTIHASNSIDVFCRDYGPSKSLIWSC